MLTTGAPGALVVIPGPGSRPRQPEIREEHSDDHDLQDGTSPPGAGEVGPAWLQERQVMSSQFLSRLRDRACRLPLDVFAREHQGLFLLGFLPEPEEDDDFGFATQVSSDVLQQAELMLAGDAARLLDGKLLQCVQKTDRNPWARRITVGRAANNDVVVRHPSVSKLHAYFELPRRPATDPPWPGASDPPLASLRFADAGSRNGTQVDGRALEADAPVPVGPGARLVLGEVDCELLDAPRLHDTLRTLFPSPELFRGAQG